MSEMSFNVPSRIKHQFKLRNPKKQANVQVEDDLELMSTNLLKLQQQLTEECQDGLGEQINFDSDAQNTNNHDYPLQSPPTSTISQNLKPQQSTTIQHQTQQQSLIIRHHIKSQLHRQFEQYLQSNNFSSNYEQKINQLLDCDEEVMSVGNAIGLFEMVYYFKEILTVEVLGEIQAKAFRVVVEMDDMQSLTTHIDSQQKQLMKHCYSQLIAICGTPSPDITNYYLHSLIQHPSTFSQSLNVLINQGLQSLSSLVKVINQDFQPLSQKVLKQLSRTDLIISRVIVPQIYADLLSASSSTKEKNTALCLLARIGQVAYSQQLLAILMQLFKVNCIDKKLLISAIISTGKHQGQKILINLLQQPNINDTIAIFIINCLSVSPHIRKHMRLNIQLCEYSVVDLLQMNNLFVYQGRVDNDFHFDDSQSQDILYVNSRMLVALVERFLENSCGQTVISKTECLNDFVLREIIQKEEDNGLPNLQIINTFISIIGKPKSSPKIKQSAITALGNIPLPQHPIQIIQKLIQCLFSSDPSIITATCTTLSKIEFIPSIKVVQRLKELMKHNLWKVRTSACQAIGCLVREPVDTVLEILVRCLKDGSINRELVCQTLLRIHPMCQQLLIEILKSSKDTKIQEIILCCFNEKQILLSDNLLKILQAIFDFSKNPKKQIRFICLGVVNSLRKLSIDEQIETNQFKPKNILPFYYNFLSDPFTQIRQLALEMILQFGNYAELILIEGMTKGRVNCKIECAKGLGLRGVQNFRALLLGMRDPNQKVRHHCSHSILSHFTVPQIVSQYLSHQSQRISLIYNINDLLQSPSLLTDPSSMKPFLNQLITQLSQQHSPNSLQTTCIEINNQEELEREIREFRQSVRVRETNDEDEENQLSKGENVDPNATVTQKSEEMTMSSLKKAKTAIPKRYYFRLNQTLVE